MVKTLIEILTENGFELTESGERQVTRCMFHEGDREASFTVYPNDTYFCFACEAWGDAVKFLVDYKGWIFKQATDYVGADYVVHKADKPQVIKVKNTLKSYSFLYDVSLQYHDFLMATPGAIRYIESRGITRETIEKFKLGYTDGHVLKINWAWEQEMALEMGLINKNGFELFAHRITIPNFTEAGLADFLMGRTVTNDKIKYLGARMPKPIHGFYGVRSSPVIFLAEGQFDWLTLRQWDFPAAVISGSHLSKPNLALLRTKKVVIVPDYDDQNQGMNAAKKIQAQLGENCFILDYSELKTEPGKLDISMLAEDPYGQMKFIDVVERKLPWITLLSRTTLTRWFPTLVNSTPLLST